ncbi:MAG: aromatic ring-hydroxylating dioxygenase subunit alpha [Gammaproteobacteria bacterium]|nr:aromatic ring-hydroxylating dioxygenase subunit alpha [Gammaproteobacteria bacterium]
MTSRVVQQPACFDFAPNDRLRALPARYYVEADVLAREREQVFFRSWQYACHIDQLDGHGAYVATEIMGQNVFVVRDRDGELKAFYNVCPHRGHKLLEGAGHKKVIVCPYHQWSYSLDGKLRHDRSTASSETPDVSAICLAPVRVDRLFDFVFVNLDPGAEPIADFWPGLEEQVKSAIPDLDRYQLSAQASALHSVDVKANWKIQVDNFLECYHCRIGHESFADMLDVARQKQTLHPNYSYVFIPSSGKVDNKAYPLLPEHDVMDLHFWHLFPNIALAQFAGPGNLSLSQWTPRGMDRAYRDIVQLDIAEPTDPGMLERRELRTAWARDVLQQEDIAFMESVHEGMSQRCFEHGWYMIDPDNQEISEVMLRHFHETYLHFMQERAV